MSEQIARPDGQTFEQARAEWWAGLRSFARKRRKSVDVARTAWTKFAGDEPQQFDGEASSG